MSELKVIAVEIPFMISNLPKEAVNACIYLNGKLYMLTRYGELKLIGDYNNIDVLVHAINEGRYEWADFSIEEGRCIYRDYDNDVIVDDKFVALFPTYSDSSLERISNIGLKLFNDFLRISNKDNKDMNEALNISFNDGFFRKEVLSIVKDDVVTELYNTDKEIIVRTKLEGKDFIIKKVKEMLKSESPDKFIDINYLFRRMFVMEKYGYIAF
ncbi:MAG: hypothetical protein ACOZCL_14095 [Bacillota bacterium]